MAPVNKILTEPELDASPAEALRLLRKGRRADAVLLLQRAQHRQDEASARIARTVTLLVADADDRAVAVLEGLVEAQVSP
jgi:hypothetical protein